MGFSEIIAFILGILCTVAVSEYYHRKASNELKSEAADLINRLITILEGLKEANLADREEDDKGNILGYKLKVPGFPVDVIFGEPQLVVHPEEKGNENNS